MKTWGDLRQPAYALAALEAFLVGAGPVWGIGAIDTESVSRALVVPTTSMILVGALSGLLNGVRALRTLAMPPPGVPPAAPAVAAGGG